MERMGRLLNQQGVHGKIMTGNIHKDIFIRTIVRIELFSMYSNYMQMERG